MYKVMDNKAEIEKFFKVWSDDISVLCRAKCICDDDVSDCISEVVSLIVENWSKISKLKDPRLKIVHYSGKVAEKYNKLYIGREDFYCINVKFVENTVINRLYNERKDLLEYLKSKLTEEEIMLLDDYYLRNVSVKEIAYKKALHEQTIYSRLKKLRKKMRALADRFYKERGF